jgi:hypothetical protein
VVVLVVVVFGVSLVLSPTRCGLFIGSGVGVVGVCDMSIAMSCMCDRVWCCVGGFVFVVLAAVVVLAWGAVSFLGACQKMCVVYPVLPLRF